MSNTAIGLIITGFIILVPSLILAVLGVPDEIDLGKTILQSLGEATQDYPQSHSIVNSGMVSLDILKWGSIIIPIVLISIGVYLLFAEQGGSAIV